MYKLYVIFIDIWKKSPIIETYKYWRNTDIKWRIETSIIQII